VNDVGETCVALIMPVEVRVVIALVRGMSLGYFTSNLQLASIGRSSVKSMLPVESSPTIV
jgi:hypothetical protein